MKTLSHLSLLTFLIATLQVNAQYIDTTFVTPYIGSYNNSDVKNDAAGNLYHFGNFTGTKDFNPGSGVFNLIADAGGSTFIVKYNSNGDFIWAVKYLKNTFVDITPDGVIYLAGVFSNVVDFDPGPGIYYLESAGSTDIFVATLNVSGELITAKRIGSSSNDVLSGMAASSSGEMHLVGEINTNTDMDPSDDGIFYLNPFSVQSKFTLRLSGSLDFIAASKFTVPGATMTVQHPFNSTDYFSNPATSTVTKVMADDDNNTYVAGLKKSTVELPDGTFDYYQLFIQRIGGYSVTFQSTVNVTDDVSIHDAALDGEGNMYIIGAYIGNFNEFPVSSLRSNGYIIVMNSVGDIVWDRSFKPASIADGTTDSYVEGVAVDINGNIFVSGTIWSPSGYDFDPGSAETVLSGNFLTKYNPAGDLEWVIASAYFQELSSANSNTLWARNGNSLTKYGVPSCVSSPYPVSDPIWQQVIEEDSYCCTTSWDAVCESHYLGIFSEGCVASPYNTDDPKYLEVIDNDHYCCQTEWDDICQDAYDDLIEACVDSPYDSEDIYYQEVIYQNPSCCSTLWDGSCQDLYDFLSTGATIEVSVNWNSSCGSRAAIFQLYEHGTTNLVYSTPTTLYSSGQFTLTNVNTGTFDVFLKVEGYLKKGISNQVIDDMNVLPFGTIKAGDLNNDNQINAIDLSIFGVSFSKSTGQTGYNALADLNCDGNVNLTDVSILGTLFGQVGDNAPM